VSKVVAAPTLTPSAGTYTSTQTVIIATTTTSATIRYTTDGTTPTSTIGTVYSEPLTVSEMQTIQAIACKVGWIDSEKASAVYTFPNVIGMISIPAGTFQRDSTSTNTSTVSSFHMSEKEITRAQFASVMGTDPNNSTYSSDYHLPTEMELR